MKHTILIRLASLVALGSVGVTACQKSATSDTPVTPAVASSFNQLQQKILTPSCATAGCHASDKDATYSQHGLVLAAGLAYDNLVKVSPRNTSAKADGLLRVKPFAALESLLYHKLYFDQGVHHSSKQYGNPMPLGSQPLSVGQIEFVRRWIEAGAPKDGNPVDAKLLDDTTPSVSATFDPLAPPTATEGYQMRIEPFDVAPNFERELFVRKLVGNTQDVYVSRIVTKMRGNSHHFVAYDFQNKGALPTLDYVRDLRNADNSLNLLTALSMSNHIFEAGTQSPSSDYTFPEGTALLIPAGASLDLNSHYVNKTSSTIKGEVYMNLYTTDKSKVTQVVKTFNLANNSLSIPANGKVTLSKTFIMPKTVKILSLTSHTHKLGEKFVIKIKGGTRDGEVVYTSTTWEHPEMTTYKVPIVLSKGEALVSEITYTNTTSKAVSFGLTSEDEMGIIFGYYYEEN